MTKAARNGGEAMAQQRIKGQVKWLDLATGFWGITDENQQDWRPLNLPEHLQQDGLTVDLTVELVEESERHLHRHQTRQR